MSNNDTQTYLCKGLRACGIPKKETHEILNTVQKWISGSGMEWTNQRIKDLRQWYETYLAGRPSPPEWFRHTKEGLPVGIWNWVFKLPIAKALAVLSLNTAFIVKDNVPTETQKKKFYRGLAGNRNRELEFFETPAWQRTIQFAKRQIRSPHLPKEMPVLQPVTIADISKSCPIRGCLHAVTPHTDAERLSVLEQSWESVPQATFDFLVSNDRWDILPPAVIGNNWQLELNRPHCSAVGRIGVIQEPQLKARIVANPNRVLQHTLEPLQRVLSGLVKSLPTSCIFDQESGMSWVQGQLNCKYTMAGSDLTSASDLLDLELCLRLIQQLFGVDSIEGYREYSEYFFEVSRAPWITPWDNQAVHWQQGDPLGTGPSIFILDLANASAGYTAYAMAVLDGWNPSGARADQCFRTLGDDIIMRAEMLPYYERVIHALGGEINFSKTLISDQVAEFAGRVITTKCVYLKKVNYREPSDSSFMSYMSELGDQAKWFLRPRQRRVYEAFWPVPGIVVSGPWQTDGFGEPLSERYQWYLEEVQPAFSREEPDPSPVTTNQRHLAADLQRQEERPNSRRGGEYSLGDEYVVPFFEPEDYRSSVSTNHKVGGDPRLTEGKTALEILEGKLDIIQPYSEWKSTNNVPDQLKDDQDATGRTRQISLGETISKKHAAEVNQASGRAVTAARSKSRRHRGR